MRKVLIPVAVVALVVAAAGGVALASVPGPDGVIHGCYQSGGLGDGALYVIDSAAECPTGFTGVDWDQTAPTGIAGYEVVTNMATASSAPTQTISADASCPTGTVAIGGGGASELLNNTKPIVASGVAVGWTAQGSKINPNGGGLISTTVWAICATQETP